MAGAHAATAEPSDFYVQRAICAMRSFEIDPRLGPSSLRTALAWWAHYDKLTPGQVDVVVAYLTSLRDSCYP